MVWNKIKDTGKFSSINAVMVAVPFFEYFFTTDVKESKNVNSLEVNLDLDRNDFLFKKIFHLIYEQRN